MRCGRFDRAKEFPLPVVSFDPILTIRARTDMASARPEVEDLTIRKIDAARPAGKDRRRHARFPLGLPVGVQIAGRPEPITVELLDLSATGGRFRSLGDRVRVDLNKGTANILISEAELDQRRAALATHGYAYPASQTPWQEIQRSMVDQLAAGMVLKPAVKFQRVAQTSGIPRNSH